MDLNSLEGYTMVHAEESWGEKGNFGIKIYVKDTERDALEIPVNRHGVKAKYDTDGDYKSIYDAVKILKDGIRSATERLKPDFEQKRAQRLVYYRSFFERAGIAPVYVEKLPNGYCSNFCCLDHPWAKVTTTFGRFTIGWRKNVINLDWTESEIKMSGEELFPHENVTKGGPGEERFIHCHGVEKAVEYLKVLKAESES